MELEKKINQCYNKFHEVDKHIAKSILNEKRKCEEVTIQQFANEIHVSQSALTRFAQKIGLQGYKEIKSMIRLERIAKPNIDFDYKKVVIENYHKVIHSLQSQNNDALFLEIKQAKRILIFADGFAMSKVASECKRMLLPLEKIIYYVHGHDMIESFGAIVEEDDLVFIFSLEGSSKTVVTLAKNLQVKKGSVVSITKLHANELSTLCDFNLYVHAMELPTQFHLQVDSNAPFFLLMELLIIQYQFYLEHNFKK